MKYEVIIENTTFIVSNFSAEGTAETLEEMLRRVIIKNAESEFKKQTLNETLAACTSCAE